MKWLSTLRLPLAPAFLFLLCIPIGSGIAAWLIVLNTESSAVAGTAVGLACLMSMIGPLVVTNRYKLPARSTAALIATCIVAVVGAFVVIGAVLALMLPSIGPSN